MLRPSLSVAKKSFRHAQAFFRASKSSGKWGSSSCRTPFPGFPHTPFRPVDERLPRFGGSLRKGRSVCSGLPSAWRKSLFATLRHFSELQKALKNGDHPRAGHPSRVSRTHPSAPLTKVSRSFDRFREGRSICSGLSSHFGHFSTSGVPCRLTPPRGDSSPRRRSGGRDPRDRPRYPHW